MLSAAGCGAAAGFLLWLQPRRFLPLAALNLFWASAGWIRRKKFLPLAALWLSWGTFAGFMLHINRQHFSHPDRALVAEKVPWDLAWGCGRTVKYAAKRLPRVSWTGLTGVWLDRRYGIVGGHPLLALFAPTALALGLRRWNQREHRRWIALFVTVYVTTAGTTATDWRGGEAAHPGRYLVATLPLLALPLACWLTSQLDDRRNSLYGFRSLAALSVIATVFLAGWACYYRFEHPAVAYSRCWPGFHRLLQALPSFCVGGATGEPVWENLLKTLALWGLGTLAFSPASRRLPALAWNALLWGSIALLSAI